MPKLLLIQPPIEDFYDTDIRLQPIGLAYLKAAIKKHLPHFEVKIIDFHHGWGRYTIPVPSELKYLREYYIAADKSPFCSFHQYYRFGASDSEISQAIADEKPDVVGISCLFSPYYREALRCAELAKDYSDIPVLVGGSHVSADPDSVLRHPAVDFVIRGEGERPLVEFLSHWEKSRSTDEAPQDYDWSRVPNLGYQKLGENHLNPIEDNDGIEDLPFPDLSDFALEKYTYESKPLAMLITSRSCPHRCSFCSVHATFGTQYRRRRMENVLQEIELRYSQGYRVIDFEDDNLTFYRHGMVDLCREIIGRFPRGDLQLVAMNGISYLSLDEELLTLMKAAGFTHLNLALVSSDHSVRESTKRPHTIKKYLEVVRTAIALELKVVSYQILGLPQESLESMVQTLCFAAQLPVLVGASLFYMTPNSPIAKQLSYPVTDENIFRSRLTAMAIETEHFIREDLYTLFVTTRIFDFLKSLKLPSPQSSLSEIFLENPDRLSPREKIGFELLQRFFATRVLEAWTSRGFQPLKKFKAELFLKIWAQCDWILTQGGQKIFLSQ